MDTSPDINSSNRVCWISQSCDPCQLSSVYSTLPRIPVSTPIRDFPKPATPACLSIVGEDAEDVSLRDLTGIYNGADNSGIVSLRQGCEYMLHMTHIFWWSVSRLGKGEWDVSMGYIWEMCKRCLVRNVT